MIVFIDRLYHILSIYIALCLDYRSNRLLCSLLYALSLLVSLQNSASDLDISGSSQQQQPTVTPTPSPVAAPVATATPTAEAASSTATATTAAVATTVEEESAPVETPSASEKKDN